MSMCKVERVSEAYDVNLVERVREAHRHGKSLRELEEEAGAELVRHLMEQADMDYVEGDERRYYRILSGEKDNPVARKQVRRQLERSGVDVEAMLSSVPSYQTIRHHLQQCEERDTSGEKSNEVTAGDVSETVRAAEARVERVVEQSIETLDISSADYINNSTIVRCEKCGSAVDVHDFFEDGCRCV